MVFGSAVCYAAGLGQAPARQCLFKAGLSESIPATAINKVCGSGMEAHICAYLSLQSGARMVLAGGMESMSNVPYLWPRHSHRMGAVLCEDSLIQDGLLDFFSQTLMGQLAEKMAQDQKISREDQDAYAMESARRAQEGQDFFIHEKIQPPSSFAFQDEPLERVVLERIPHLNPVFNGSITPATASPLADGAAFSLMTHQKIAIKHDLEPLAIFRGYSHYATHSEHFITAPLGAITTLLAKVGWSIQEVDFFEINEAFTLVPLLAIRELHIPKEKVNLYGSSCAIGHPLGATGARLVVTLAHILQIHKKKKGVAALCVGGGEGIAIALESC